MSKNGKGYRTASTVIISMLVNHVTFWLCFRNRSFPCLHVIEERHEPEVHVELLVTMEQSKTRIIGDKVNV